MFEAARRSMDLKRSKATKGSALGASKRNLEQKVDVLGVAIDDFSQEEAVDKIMHLAQDPAGGHSVVTVNSEILMLAKRDPKFWQILKDADLAVADGIGVVLAKLILGGKEQVRITGVDLVEKLCGLCAKKGLTVGFLGGFDDVAKKLAERQKIKHPGLKVALADPGDVAIGQKSKPADEVLGKVRVDILFVAYGMGRQEFWIAKNKNLLNFGVAIGVGGAFDLLATVKRRAPIFVQKWGMEWLWRLIQEPWRIRRMRVLPIFAFLVLKELLTAKIFGGVQK